MSGLTLRIDGGIAEIELDDGKVNALSESMLDSLLDAIAQAATADAALLITGRSGCFSGGYDRKLIDAGGPACDAMRAAGDRLTMALLDYPAPVVIACTGHAMAKAAFMLLLADYRIGSEGAFRVALNEVAIGMTMPRPAMRLAEARLAAHWLSRCALQAQSLKPADALDAGFFDELLPAEQVLERARDKARALSALPRQAYRETRALLNGALRAEIAALMSP
jgi:enoyl-CoA hydratase